MGENVVGRQTFPNCRGAIARLEFVVLDPRSIEDNTCLVYHRVDRMPEDSPGDEWDEDKIILEWKVWRVKFLVAWWLITGLGFADDVMFDTMEDEKDTYTDKDGGFQMPYKEHDMHEHPDLENCVPWGPAP